MTNHDTSIFEIKSEPINLNTDTNYVDQNMIMDVGEDTLNYNSKMPGYYIFVQNEEVFQYFRE